MPRRFHTSSGRGSASRRSATRTGGLLFDVHELALARQRLEQVLEHLPHPAPGRGGYREARWIWRSRSTSKVDWQVVTRLGRARRRDRPAAP